VLDFSKFLTTDLNLKKKLKTFLKLMLKTSTEEQIELRTFSFFQGKHIRTETTIFTKINLSEKKNSFGVFDTKNAKKSESEEKLLQYVDTLCSFVAG